MTFATSLELDLLKTTRNGPSILFYRRAFLEVSKKTCIPCPAKWVSCDFCDSCELYEIMKVGKIRRLGSWLEMNLAVPDQFQQRTLFGRENLALAEVSSATRFV
jgi:hypothetical protein